MFTYFMKSKIEELIDEKLNQEFPEEVEIRENQEYDSEEEMTSETEETDDDESETNNANVNNFLDSANMAMNMESAMKLAEDVENLLLMIGLISFLQRSRCSYLLLCFPFYRVACLHVSFTAYEYFNKLSKSALSFRMVSSFRKSETRNPTITHVFTCTLVHSSKNTYWRSLSGDPLYIHVTFWVTWAYPNVNQHFTSKSLSECLSVCPVLI